MEIKEAKRAKLRAVTHDSLISYTKVCDPHYVASKVHYFLADKLQDVAWGLCNRLIITMPPRHGKSRLVSVELPTWMLGMQPTKNVVLTSYGSDLCYKHSREARGRLRNPLYQQLFDTRLDPHDQAAMDWSTTEGGHFKAVGIGGSLTGHGADLLIIDDPFKDFAEAHSPTIRENVWDWFLSVAFTRLSPEGRIVIIMTPWHVDDLVGRLRDPARKEELADAGAEDEHWEELKLPAIAHEDDLLGRKAGDALFPERFPIERLKSIRAVEGSYKWSAMFDCNPTVKGGNYINSANFQIMDPSEVPLDLIWVRAWDLAATESSRADFTAGVCAAMGKDGKFYLKDMVKGQWDWPNARGRIVTTANAEIKYVRAVGVEAVGGFKTAFSNLKEVMPKNVLLREWGADKDKLTRALPWIALTERKHVVLVRGDWNMDFMIQCEAFPGGSKHDDCIDATTLAYQMLQSSLFMNITALPENKATQAISYRRNRSMSGI